MLREITRAGRRERAARSVAQGLGWFGIALGVTELLASRAIARELGMDGREGLVRAFGVRELATGVGLLAGRDPAPWMLGRVAGDAVDLAALASALDRDHPARGRVGAALGAMAAIAVLDSLCAGALMRGRGEVRHGRASEERRPSAARPHRGFGVQVSVSEPGRDARVQPLVVIARDERDAELVAARIPGAGEAQTVKELTPEEIRNYGLDPARHGDMRALPVLNL